MSERSDLIALAMRGFTEGTRLVGYPGDMNTGIVVGDVRKLLVDFAALEAEVEKLRKQVIAGVFDAASVGITLIKSDDLRELREDKATPETRVCCSADEADRRMAAESVPLLSAPRLVSTEDDYQRMRYINLQIDALQSWSRDREASKPIVDRLRYAVDAALDAARTPTGGEGR